MGDVLDHPLGDQEVGQLGQAPPGKRQPVIGRGGLGDLLDLPPLGQREHRRVPAGVPRVQRVKAVGAEVVQHVADPVLAGKSQPRDLRHAHALRRPQHHLRPPPRHHRPGPAAHDPFQAITLVIADLTHSHRASHTRQCDPINQRTESQKAALARRKQGKRRQLRHGPDRPTRPSLVPLGTARSRPVNNGSPPACANVTRSKRTSLAFGRSGSGAIGSTTAGGVSSNSVNGAPDRCTAP